MTYNKPFPIQGMDDPLYMVKYWILGLTPTSPQGNHSMFHVHKKSVLSAVWYPSLLRTKIHI